MHTKCSRCAKFSYNSDPCPWLDLLAQRPTFKPDFNTDPPLWWKYRLRTQIANHSVHIFELLGKSDPKTHCISTLITTVKTCLLNVESECVTSKQTLL